MSQPILDISHLTKKFPKVVALKDVSLKIYRGEYIALIGPTGAGKTTLLKAITGILPIDDGTIVFNGKNITDLPPESRNIAFMPQNYALFPKMNVFDNAIFSPRVKGENEEEAEKIVTSLLEMVHLNNRTDAFPDELSGGMQQRLALVRTIASNCDLILLDEPLRALDARLRITLRKELQKLAKDLQKTVIHVTHDQEEALSVGDRLIVLNNGKIEQFDTPFTCYENPASPFVNYFLGEVNVFTGTIIEQKESETVIQIGKSLQIYCDKTNIPLDSKVLLSIKPEHVVITRKSKDVKNHHQGHIVNQRFLGKWTNLLVKIDGIEDDITLRTKTPTLFVPKFVDNNIKLTIYWNTRYIKLFRLLEPVITQDDIVDS